MISGTHFPKRQLLKTIEKALGNYQDCPKNRGACKTSVKCEQLRCTSELFRFRFIRLATSDIGLNPFRKNPNIRCGWHSYHGHIFTMRTPSTSCRQVKIHQSLFESPDSSPSLRGSILSTRNMRATTTTAAATMHITFVAISLSFHLYRFSGRVCRERLRRPQSR